MNKHNTKTTNSLAFLIKTSKASFGFPNQKRYFWPDENVPQKSTFREKTCRRFLFNGFNLMSNHTRVLNMYSSYSEEKTKFCYYTTKSFDMAAISWSMISHGMLVMEHAEPWKAFHDYVMIMEKLQWFLWIMAILLWLRSLGFSECTFRGRKSDKNESKWRGTASGCIGTGGWWRLLEKESGGQTGLLYVFPNASTSWKRRASSTKSAKKSSVER